MKRYQFSEEACNAILDALGCFSRGIERERLDFRAALHACAEEWYDFRRVQIVINEDATYLTHYQPATHADIIIKAGGN